MNLNKILRSLFGDKASRDNKLIRPFVEKVKAVYPLTVSYRYVHDNKLFDKRYLCVNSCNKTVVVKLFGDQSATIVHKRIHANCGKQSNKSVVRQQLIYPFLQRFHILPSSLRYILSA